MSDTKFNQDEYILLEQTLNEKIQQWTATIDELNKHLQDAKSTLTKIRELSSSYQKTGKSDTDRKLQVILQIFRESKKAWIQSGYIREQYRIKDGVDISKSTLRNYLKATYNGVHFERQGEKRHTKWKLVEEA